MKLWKGKGYLSVKSKFSKLEIMFKLCLILAVALSEDEDDED